MGDRSNIGWTMATWNPWVGCTKVSPGCAHCYMFRQERRWGRHPDVVRRTSPQVWRMPLRLVEPTMVFTCSMSDFFHEAADEWRDEAWDIIRRTPEHTYQVLTKRPERIADHLPADWGNGYPNVWLGTSVENQFWAQQRIPVLARVPARVRFLSCEPLLKPLYLEPWLEHREWFRVTDDGADAPDGATWGPFERRQDEWVRVGGGPINWVIVGGESGPRPRSMDLEWVRSIRDQCQESGVPFFYKQPGGKPFPNEDEAVLDGRQWREMPAVPTASND